MVIWHLPYLSSCHPLTLCNHLPQENRSIQLQENLTTKGHTKKLNYKYLSELFLFLRTKQLCLPFKLSLTNQPNICLLVRVSNQLSMNSKVMMGWLFWYGKGDGNNHLSFLLLLPIFVHNMFHFCFFIPRWCRFDSTIYFTKKREWVA